MCPTSLEAGGLGAIPRPNCSLLRGMEQVVCGLVELARNYSCSGGPTAPVNLVGGLGMMKVHVSAVKRLTNGYHS